MSDLTEQIKTATTKDALAPLAEELGVTVEKRQGVETLRANLLAVDEKPPETEPASGTKGATTKGKKPKGRRLKNRDTGRVFTYSPRLAKRRDMKEV